MKSSILVVACVCVSGALQASWYWPFGSDEAESAGEARISELIEPASQLIDEAADLASEGKVDESVAKYRKALLELDRIENENPERAKRAEFATVRNKRAYVNAAIDSMLLSQVRSNAKAVAVSDTAELEKKLYEERHPSAKTNAAPKEVESPQPAVRDEPKAAAKPTAKPVVKPAAKPAVRERPKTKREQAMLDIANGDFAAAEILIAEMLTAKPHSAMALNLKATMLARQEKYKEAEAALDEAISYNPRNYFAYYNMAYLLLQKNAENKSSAKRFYETGRAMGGPANASLEEMLK